MFRWRLLFRQIHLRHNKYVEAASFSSPEDSLVHTIVTGKYFLRFWLYLGHICSRVLLVKHPSVVLGKQFPWRMIIRPLLLCRKARNFVFAIVYLAAFDYFRPGIMLFDRPSELSTLCPVPGLLINSPGYEVDAGPCFNYSNIRINNNNNNNNNNKNMLTMA